MTTFVYQPSKADHRNSSCLSKKAEVNKMQNRQPVQLRNDLLSVKKADLPKRWCKIVVSGGKFQMGKLEKHLRVFTQGACSL